MKIQKRKSGQAMTEYIIVVAVVALAALTMFGLFGDTIRNKLRGVMIAFGAEATGTEGTAAVAGDSKKVLKDMDAEGTVAP